MEREVLELAKILLLTISAPIKPGALHRLRVDSLYEEVLQEALHVIAYMEEAYRRGVEVSQGSRVAASLGLGRIVGDSLRSSFEDLERRPLIGLHVAPITLASILGYTRGEEGVTYTRVNRGVKTLLYGSRPEDVLDLISGMEATSLGEELRYLDSQGITRNTVMLRAMSLGDIYEVLERVDTGFMLTLRGLRRLRDMVGRVDKRSQIRAIVSSYLELLGSFKDIKINGIDPRTLVRYDRELSHRGDELNRLLGGTFLLATLSMG